MPRLGRLAGGRWQPAQRVPVVAAALRWLSSRMRSDLRHRFVLEAATRHQRRRQSHRAFLRAWPLRQSWLGALKVVNIISKILKKPGVRAWGNISAKKCGGVRRRALLRPCRLRQQRLNRASNFSAMEAAVARRPIIIEVLAAAALF